MRNVQGSPHRPSWHLLAVALVLGALLLGCTASTGNETAPRAGNAYGADLSFDPHTYVAYRAPAPLHVDGQLDEAAWGAAGWTEDFVDIQGPSHPTPRFRTRAKMLWDDDYFYVAAELEEPHVWATFTERDAIIFHENNFEVFIDPTGDTHNYYELEVNALETVWDLMLLKPYRDGGPPLDAWDIRGLKASVHINGTINDPSDRDEGWTVEIAMPWSVLEEVAPEGQPPQAGDQWRVNFSRVEWKLDVVDGRYEKTVDPESGEPLSEDNWVWSPQGAINMHIPERWGLVQFSGLDVGTDTETLARDSNRRVAWALRQLYYRQREHQRTHGTYADDLASLNAGDITVEGPDFAPTLQTTQSAYEITAPGVDGATLHIRQDGKSWTTRD